MPELIPEFTIADIENELNEFVDNAENDLIDVLDEIGNSVAEFARAFGQYQNRTGNLRTSIGYVVLDNGSPIRFGFSRRVLATAIQGRERAFEVLRELSLAENKGLVLIVVAGMDYAAAVQSYGYDVLYGGSVLGDRLMIELENRINKELAE